MSRTERHAEVSVALARLTDGEIGELLAAGVPLGTGIGGVTVLAQVAGTPVFVKRIPLTVLELAHPGSTANLFELPTYLQYGVGSPGLSAWRELRAHEATTAAMLQGGPAVFPLLYHSRIQPRVPAAVQDLSEHDTRWRDLPSARARVRALEQATSSLTLFLEYAPVTLSCWLAQHPFEEAIPVAEHGLLSAAEALADNGLVHLDAHPNNVVCDGDRLLLTDFGLVTSAGFDLDEAERHFVERHALHDRAYVMTQLVNWAVQTAVPELGSPAVRNDWITSRPDEGGVPPVLRDLLDRWAAVAVVVNAFYWRLHAGDLLAPYPEREIARALGQTQP
ncbi:MAG: hypothetical protein QOF82_354 [Frankiales bacterium]|nr:hypothetical protein [Frankiales bacterium]